MDLLKWGRKEKKKERLVNTSMSHRICKLLICDTKIQCHGAQLVKKAISLSLGLFLSLPRWSGRPITASLSVTNSNKKYHTPLVTRLIETRRLCLKLISLWCLFPCQAFSWPFFRSALPLSSQITHDSAPKGFPPSFFFYFLSVPFFFCDRPNERSVTLTWTVSRISQIAGSGRGLTQTKPEQQQQQQQKKVVMSSFYPPPYDVSPAVMNAVRTCLCLSASFIAADISDKAGGGRDRGLTH